jgi:hypothetical protein
MDPGFRSPLVELFRRGEAARDVKLLAARGGFAPRAHEQVALLVLLSDDPDPEVAATTAATLAALPQEPLRGFLARIDVPYEMRSFFKARGIEPSQTPLADAERPLVDTLTELPQVGNGDQEPPEPEEKSKLLSSLPILDRMKLAMKGTREQRAALVRDSNKLVAAAVLSSPKLTESEVEAFTKMGNVSEDVLRSIGMNRSWIKNYAIAAGLCKNPKTPPALSMQLIHRINERDLKMLTIDRNVPESLRILARKALSKAKFG